MFTAKITDPTDFEIFHKLNRRYIDRELALELELDGRRDSEAMRLRDDEYVRRGFVRALDPEIKRLRRRETRAAA